MRRSPALIQLSRDHQHALDVALRLRRATADDLETQLAHAREFWDREGARHFELEERHLVDALPDAQWREQIARMLREHERIRAAVRAVGDVEGAHELGALLRDHVRFEERELFVLLEDRLSEPQLERLGAALMSD
jgi:hemerythrin-like domain-containing protein